MEDTTGGDLATVSSCCHHFVVVKLIYHYYEIPGLSRLRKGSKKKESPHTLRVQRLSEPPEEGKICVDAKIAKNLRAAHQDFVFIHGGLMFGDFPALQR